jgi:dihydroorotate dehydrogenase
MLFIGPPFGNYIQLPYTTSIVGSFTLEKRDGLYMQILRTLRYSFSQNGWINKIGLRNKGIDWAIKNYNPKNVYSIAILNENEIEPLLKKIPNNMNIELNVSCPNAEKSMIQDNLQKFLNNERKYCIVKLSPTADLKLIDTFYKQGFRQFHCSNTLPTERGGLSGPSLVPYTSNLVTHISKKYPECEIIAGGGIQNINTIEHYKNIGAQHFAVSTIFFHPFKFASMYYNYCKQHK